MTEKRFQPISMDFRYQKKKFIFGRAMVQIENGGRYQRTFAITKGT